MKQTSDTATAASAGPSTHPPGASKEKHQQPMINIASNIKRKYNSNEIVVNNKSNFKSHLVKCQTILDNIHFDELVIRAIGNAKNRALELANQLNLNNFETFEVRPREYTIHMLGRKMSRRIRGADRDGFDPDSIDISDERLNLVEKSAIEIRVRKNKIEIEKIKQARKRDKAGYHYNRV